MEQHHEGASLYAEVTARIVMELEAGRLPWVQPWEVEACACTVPHNAGTGRACSGINVLILWGAVIERETIPQAEALMAATGADIRIGGDHAFYAPVLDSVQLPPQQAFHGAQEQSKAQHFQRVA